MRQSRLRNSVWLAAFAAPLLAAGAANAQAPKPPPVTVPAVSVPRPVVTPPRVDVPRPVVTAPRVDVPRPTVAAPRVDVPRPTVTAPRVDVPRATVNVPKVDVPKATVNVPKVDVPKATVNVPKVDVPKTAVQVPRPDTHRPAITTPATNAGVHRNDMGVGAGRGGGPVALPAAGPGKSTGPATATTAAPNNAPQKLPTAPETKGPTGVAASGRTDTGVGPGKGAGPAALPVGGPGKSTGPATATSTAPDSASPKLQTTGPNTKGPTGIAAGGPNAPAQTPDKFSGNGTAATPGSMKLQTTADPKTSAQPAGASFQVKLPDGGSGKATRNVDGTMTVVNDRGSVTLSKEQVGQIATGDMSSLKPLTAAGAGNSAAASAKGKPGDPVMPGGAPSAPSKPKEAAGLKAPVLPDAKADAGKSGSSSNNMTVMSKTGSAAGNDPPAGTVTFNGTTAVCNPSPCSPGQVYRAGNGAYAGADVTISSTGAVTPTTMTTTYGGITSVITGAGSGEQTTTVTVGGQTYNVSGGGPTTLSGNIGGQQINETRTNGVSTTSVGGTPIVTCGYSTCTVLAPTPTNVAGSPAGGSPSGTPTNGPAGNRQPIYVQRADGQWVRSYWDSVPDDVSRNYGPLSDASRLPTLAYGFGSDRQTIYNDSGQPSYWKTVPADVLSNYGPLSEASMLPTRLGTPARLNPTTVPDQVGGSQRAGTGSRQRQQVDGQQLAPPEPGLNPAPNTEKTSYQRLEALLSPEASRGTDRTYASAAGAGNVGGPNANPVVAQSGGTMADKIEKAYNSEVTQSVMRVAPEVTKTVVEKWDGFNLNTLRNIFTGAGEKTPSTLGGAIAKPAGVLVDGMIKTLDPEVYKGVKSIKDGVDATKGHGWAPGYGMGVNEAKTLNQLLKEP